MALLAIGYLGWLWQNGRKRNQQAMDEADEMALVDGEL